jgi:P4 family phage/plasmid primase-like protien
MNSKILDPLGALAEMNKPGIAPKERQLLSIGSDVEIAGRVRNDLERAHGEIVFAEGKFWKYGRSHWEDIPEHIMRLAVHIYDGAFFKTPAGQPSRVSLSKSRVDSALNEMSASLTRKDFFSQQETGINCASGFIRIGKDGIPFLNKHASEHRCRHTLPGKWSVHTNGHPPESTMLHKLLHGVFLGDGDSTQKIDLLAEVVGAAALGYATRLRQPRAVILKGETAENGKSQILDLARILLPENAICSVTAARMGDERHIVGLVGKMLNASDELSAASAIASDTFKAIVTGEPVQGRDVYKTRVEFRPVAQHLFATNTLPVFSGGMDRGVQRRLLVICFNRFIPNEERIENIGRRIGEEEADFLLAWAVAGASRLVRQKSFTIPPSSKSAMNDWLFGADPVLAWTAEQVDVSLDLSIKIRTSQAYEQFRTWALAEGFSERTLPSINAFVQRIQANAPGIEYRRTREGRFFLGMEINKSAAFKRQDGDA